ncbi:hypothetical protein Tco_1136111 [Tanacetum coccineum]
MCPYVRRMIPEPGDTDREVPVPQGEIWSLVQQMITVSEYDSSKRRLIVNEWERFTSTDGNRLSLTITVSQIDDDY